MLSNRPLKSRLWEKGGSLELHLHAAVGREGLRRGDGARVSEREPIQLLVDRADIARFEISAIEAIFPIEQILHETIDLDVVRDVVRCMEVDPSIACKKSVKVILCRFLVGEERRVAGRNEIRAELPLGGQPVLEACLEAMARNAGEAVALLQEGAEAVIVRIGGRRRRRPRRA